MHICAMLSTIGMVLVPSNHDSSSGCFLILLTFRITLFDSCFMYQSISLLFLHNPVRKCRLSGSFLSNVTSSAQVGACVGIFPMVASS